MEHPDEGTIHAWLDNALPVQESAVIAAHVAACADCAASVAEARGFIAASSRIVSALDDVPRGVLPQREVMAAASAPTSPVRASDSRADVRAWWARPQLAAAALLVVVAGTVYSVRDRDASVRDTAYESTDSALSGPALAPSAAASAAPSAAPSPEAMSARSSVPANAQIAQQSTAAEGAMVQGAMVQGAATRNATAQNAADAADAAVSGAGSAASTPRALGERTDARTETRKLEATMSAAVSAPAATSPVAPARAEAGAAAAGLSFAGAIPITPGCYATGAAGMPPRIVLTDSVVATVNARTWYRARPWPVSAQNSAAEWRWSVLETTAAELLAIARGDTTSYRVSTAARDAAGCR